MMIPPPKIYLFIKSHALCRLNQRLNQGGGLHHHRSTSRLRTGVLGPSPSAPLGELEVETAQQAVLAAIHRDHFPRLRHQGLVTDRYFFWKNYAMAAMVVGKVNFTHQTHGVDVFFWKHQRHLSRATSSLMGQRALFPVTLWSKN